MLLHDVVLHCCTTAMFKVFTCFFCARSQRGAIEMNEEAADFDAAL